jgi:hypothetical protein
VLVLFESGLWVARVEPGRSAVIAPDALWSVSLIRPRWFSLRHRVPCLITHVISDALRPVGGARAGGLGAIGGTR